LTLFDSSACHRRREAPPAGSTPAWTGSRVLKASHSDELITKGGEGFVNICG
jgi:hypothetical protein